MYFRVFFIFILLISTAMPAFAYIDPGTGSMLFSVVLGAMTTLFFIFNTIFLWLKRRVFTSKKLGSKNHPFVIYSEGKQYYCVFKPILDEFERRQIPVVFYTSEKDDPFLNDGYKFINIQYIGKGNRAYFKLAFLNADICLMTTPQLDVLQLKRSKNVKYYCHILHSVGFSCDYHLYGLDYYDCVLCDASFQIPLIREIEAKRNLPQKDCIVVGSSYIDYYEKEKQKFKPEKSNKKTVLIAPSWGEQNLLHRCEHLIMNDLANSNFEVVIRPHPQSLTVEKDYIENLKNKYKNNKNIFWNFDKDNLKILSKADVLITDFSCVMFDYAYLFERPFIYLDTEFNFEITDIADLDELPERYKIAEQIGQKVTPDDLKENSIIKFIEQVQNNTEKTEKIRNTKNYFLEYQGESAVRTVDYLQAKQKELAGE